MYTRDLNENMLASMDHITRGTRFAQLTYRSSSPPSNSIGKRETSKDLNNSLNLSLKY